MKRYLEVLGARENNLKNVSVDIPKEALTVVTGVSGSGKSSLIYDVIFSEGQRRFLESLDTYARRFAPLLKKPDVDFVFGLSPVLAIQQKKGVKNPRSTVGTMTDVSDYLRLLYSAVGTGTCPYCSHRIHQKTSNQLAERILSLPPGTTVELYAPVTKVYGEPYSYLFAELRKKGYRNLRIDGQPFSATQHSDLKEDKDYRIEACIDRFVLGAGSYKQLTSSLENGLIIGERLLLIDFSGPDITTEIRENFYRNFGCPQHHTVLGELLPWYFTANDSESACLTCRGIGTYRRAIPELVLENKNKSIREGALTNTFLSVKHPFKFMLLHSLALHYGFSLDTPFSQLSPGAKDVIFYGTRGEKVELVQPSGARPSPEAGKFITYNCVLNDIDHSYKLASRKGTAETAYDFVYKKHMAEEQCPDCLGTKLRRSRFLVTIQEKNIHQLGEMDIEDLHAFISSLSFPPEKDHIACQIAGEIINRLNLLMEIGLHYISLNRWASTISGGESQRIRLTTQISSGLSGMLYILDEPSIGLHPRDSHRIIDIMKKLRDAGNTVLVVEHDVDTMRAADHIIEIGPGPGEAGGQVVAQGKLQEIMKSKCLTGQYLSGKKRIPLPSQRRKSNGNILKIKGARHNNLKNIDVDLPLGIFICVTGVSGSGKSSLVNDILYKGLEKIFRDDPRIIPGLHEKIEGYEHIDNVINIDQAPIGRSSRSNPATYVGFFDRIRKLFAETEEAKKRGYNHPWFSSNNKLGRCDECSGHGIIVTELQFMPDVETVCPVCQGTGFTNDILEITYQGKNIAQVLAMSVEQAIQFFKTETYILRKLKVMQELGLGYIKLGQSSSTLSGGEAQRIKLATELSKKKKGAHNLYILDEPTTGLHLADIQKLLDCLNKLVDAGHTVVVIEHNLEVIKTADHIIDIGPEAGKRGGYPAAAGTPEEVAEAPGSCTGRFLREILTLPQTPAMKKV